MGVARGRLDIAVLEQLAGHRQGLAERKCPGRKGMSKVMQPDVIESGPGPNGLPNMVESVGAIA